MRLAALAVSLTAAIALAACTHPSDSVDLTIAGTHSTSAEVARTDEERRVGLSGRAEVPAGTGMLFPLDDVEDPGLWMYETLVSLDALWISAGRVVHISRMTPCLEMNPRDCPIWKPPVDVDAVLEIPAGTQDIAVGDVVELA